MSKMSILYQDVSVERMRMPTDTISDLLIEKFLERIISSERKQDLRDHFLAPLTDPKELYYRQEIFKDLEFNKSLLTGMKKFVDDMARVHRILKLVDELYYEINKKGWFLEAVLAYCNATIRLQELLVSNEVNSKGLKRFRNYLGDYINSEYFQKLCTDAKTVKENILQITYTLIIDSGKFTVKPFEGEEEYSKVVEDVFSKFKDEDCENEYKFNIKKATGMSHVEAKMMEFVRKIHPEPFELLDEFFNNHRSFMDEEVLCFEKEIQFYIVYLDFVNHLEEKGLRFCYPTFVEFDEAEIIYDVFDVLLADSSSTAKVVCNDILINSGEKVIIITGPNQGGKTTLAKTYGMVHYLASLGLPVPASKAQMYLPDGIFTHFERQEVVQSQKSKLEEDLIRIRDILSNVTSKSVVILNEIFSSASLSDATNLSEKILDELLKIGCITVWVTFLDQLARKADDRIVSMVSLVSPDDPTIRTFKIVRKMADGKAYALSLAEKYGLTYKRVKERVRK